MTEPLPPDDTALARPPVDPAELARDPRRLAAVLATVLDQQSRDASANRAQARELIRAVDGLAKAHEYLGKELGDERRRSRWLVAALVVLPVLVILGATAVLWGQRGSDERLDALRAQVDRDLADLRTAAGRRDAENLAAVRDAVREDYEGRLGAASKDAESLRSDLDATRASLAEERRVREAKERETAARLAEAERERAELTGLRSESGALREIAGAERARADELARVVAEAARNRTAESPGAPQSVPTAGPAATTPSPPMATPSALPSPPAATPTARPPAKPVPPAPTPAPVPPPSPGAASPDTAVRDPADLDRIRTRINTLLEGTTGAARYEIQSLAGVSGTELLGVLVVGRDSSGRTLRTVESGKLEIAIQADGGVRLRFTDGHLVVGGRQAPFFDGAYTLALDGTPEPWRNSGLSCIKLP